MTARKTLTKVVLAPILAGAIAVSGCSINHSQYKYNGKIGEDVVTFYEEDYSIISDTNLLIVRKPNGTNIEYVDLYNDDLKLEGIKITKNGKTTLYEFSDEVGKPVVEKAQKQFDDYLIKIKEAKIKEGLKNLE